MHRILQVFSFKFQFKELFIKKLLNIVSKPNLSLLTFLRTALLKTTPWNRAFDRNKLNS